MALHDSSDVYSVRDVTYYIKSLFEQSAELSNVKIQGEISNFKHYPSGHMYFTLKDESCKIKMVMFSFANRKLPFVPRDGMQVIAYGAISVYERDGQYQMTVSQMQEAGLGQLFLQLEQLKSKLVSEGIFDPIHKQPLPKFPRTVGVITSPAGAVIRDIVTTIERRYPLANILLYPAQVQGADAPQSLTHAIETMNRLAIVDVLIVGRGGGSLEELWAFNDERLARAIYASTIPIISAVGHETDFTIADFVADQRAATPTAAAELAVPDHAELAFKISQVQNRLRRALQLQAIRTRERFSRLQHTPWLLDPLKQLQQPMQTLDYLTQRLRAAWQNKSAQKKEKLGIEIAKLSSLNPLEVLHRGYSLVYEDVAERNLITPHRTNSNKSKHSCSCERRPHYM